MSKSLDNDSRTSNSIKNIIFGFGNTMIMMILGFVNRSVFVHCLSMDYLGISGLFSDILSMLSLADLGFGTAMVYSMYKPLAEKDYDRLAGLIGIYKKIYRVIAIGITTIGLALIPFLGYIIKLDGNLPYIKVYYVLYLMNTVASYLVVYKTSIVSADQKGYILTNYRSMFSIIQTICMTLFLYLTKNYMVYLCVQVFFTYTTNFYMSHIAKKMYPFIERKVSLPFSEAKDIFKNIKSVFIYKLSGILLNATDNTLISVLIGTAMVGYCSNYNMVATKITAVISTLFYSLTASLGNLVVLENEEKRYRIFQIMQTVSNILSTVCVTCVYFLLEDLIRVWLGESYILEKRVLIAITCNFYLGVALFPIWTFREATGLYRKTKYIMLATATINLVLSVVLGKTIGLSGIIFASAISRVVTYFWVEPKLLFRTYFGKSCLVYFLGIAKSLLTMFVIFLLEYFIIRYMIPQTWLSLFLKAVLVGGISLAVTILVYCKTEGFQLIKQKVMGMIQKN